MDQDSQIIVKDDEIDLRELFATLLAHWWLIGCVSVICVVLAGYYAFVIATPKYESESVFQMPEAFGGRSSGALGGLTGLAGLSLPKAGGVNVFDQVKGRNFIVELSEELDLEKDSFFNGALNPPGMRTRLLRAIGVIGEAKSPTKDGILAGIVETFRANVAVSNTANGAFSVVTTHTDPEAAARVSNAVAQGVLLKHRDKQIADQRARVEHLSGELAKAQGDLDQAVERVQAFAIANNMLSVQELMQQSQQLVKMRDRKQEIAENIAGLEALQTLLDLADSDEAALTSLLDERPQLRQRETMLLLGEPAGPEAWLDLPEAVVSRAISGLSAQLAQIERSLVKFQQEAAATAENVAELAKLERDVKVATATYKVMVEQFKAQALTSGFELSPLGTIFETAAPAIKPSQPKKSLVVALGLVLGLFLGAGLALVRSIRKGGLYSQGAVRDLIGSAARYYRRPSLPDYVGRQADRLLARFRNSTSAELAELSFALNSEVRPVLILPPSKREAQGLSLLAASQLAGENSKTVIVDFFGQIPGDGRSTEGTFRLRSLEPGLDIARPETTEAIHPRAVAQQKFAEELKTLISGYDGVVLLSTPFDHASYVSGALMALKPLILTSARPGKVTSGALNKLLALLPEGRRNNGGILVIC